MKNNKLTSTLRLTLMLSVLFVLIMLNGCQINQDSTCIYPQKLIFEGKIYDTPSQIPYKFLTKEQVDNIQIVRIQVCDFDSNWEEENKKLTKSQVEQDSE